jgi:hypothetical protein
MLAIKEHGQDGVGARRCYWNGRIGGCLSHWNRLGIGGESLGYVSASLRIGTMAKTQPSSSRFLHLR